MNGQYMFGCGRGKISQAKARRINKIARGLGAEFVTYYEPGCGCGYGCDRFNGPTACPARARYHFATRNYGPPFNENTARAVFEALDSAGIALP